MSKTDRVEDREWVIPIQGIAPVEELDGVKPSLTGQSLMDGCPGFAEPLRECSHRQPELVSPLLEPLGQSLVGAVLQRLLGWKRSGIFPAGCWHALGKQVY